MLHLFDGMDINTELLLIIALIFVLCYEAINGFHDTANAVVTVIYTRTMRAQLAVIMSGIFNFFGVLLGGLSVAYTIVHLLPTDLLLNVGSSHGIVMIFSMLLTAIIWNLSTWYMGLPTSSSHTLISAIIGIALTNTIINNNPLLDSLNVFKIIRVFSSLIISPIIGLIISGGLIFILRHYCSDNKKYARIHMTPSNRKKIYGKKKPPFWTRVILILSALGVSYSHGSNDGQKGIGLIMLVLISIAPSGFVVNINSSDYEITRTRDAIINLEKYYKQHMVSIKILHKSNKTHISRFIDTKEEGKKFHCYSINEFDTINQTKILFNDLKNYNQLSVINKIKIRNLLLCMADTIDKFAKLPDINTNDKYLLCKLKLDLLCSIEYAPFWIIVIVALAIGIGTMIGWRRVASTIGNKIGKKGMTYAQGMCAQITAAISIGIASYTGMPVSTTHILSSSVAGAMLADRGEIHWRTIKHIIMAWILTIPICILLSGLVYWLILKLI
ncbi:anion permease [Candidatus Pantoea edessiphila]|uniref:Phosphate transporter n=1 Tax=Candidatus Pantoea edessiphila TaxID=2044610 RepID=A0A2P5SXN1_9GAMM|nr:inorganic phosphate transporter PitA [Candidatus Pantoea edessiphila]MBK4775711.1 inorganic phosphate transporter PitA [Pantoea sp. Edef]PPI87060.1 anion permease [Candidatus Pantoea edessiphila]